MLQSERYHPINVKLGRSTLVSSPKPGCERSSTPSIVGGISDMSFWLDLSVRCAEEPTNSCRLSQHRHSHWCM